MKTHLDYVYEHEVERANDVWLTQPMGGGVVADLTWREAMGEARRMAAHLRARALPRPSQIAIFAKNNAWWFLADLAIWMAGHVSVPLYATLTPETIRQVLEHSDARLIFVGKLDGFAQMEAGISRDMPRIAMPLAPLGAAPDGSTWADVVARTEPIEGRPTRDPDELATIIYTSGSTGIPKGVMHSFRTMSAAMVFGERMALTHEDRMLSYLPLAHAFERAVVETSTMRTAMRVFFAESLDTFVEDLRRARPTIFISVPRLWTKFQQAVFTKVPPQQLEQMLANPEMRDGVRKMILGGLGLSEVRHAGTGSAPIPAALLEWYRALGLDLLEGYAMTENFCVSHATRPEEVRAGYVGRPQDGVEQRITEQGEILVKSPGTMLGYYKARALTDEVLDADGFLHTGDRGELDQLGRLRITGRVKELFKTSKGKYVAPAPIENTLLLHDDVEQALVSGAGMPQPYGMVVLSDAARERAKDVAMRATLERSLEEHFEGTNGKLDPHERLAKIVVVSDPWTIENGMLTPTMKLKRDAIEKRYAAKVEGWFAEQPRVLWA